MSVLRTYLELDRRIWVLAAARAVSTMGFSIVMPFLAVYLVETRGFPGVVYGAIFLLSGVLGALAQAGAGELSDRFGRRPLMVAGMSLRSVNFVILGVAVLYASPLALLACLIIVNALLRALFDPVASAAVTELAPVDKRTAAFGLQRVGVNLGWALGPALGGKLAGVYSYGSLFFASAVILLLAGIAVAVWLRGVPPPSAPPSALLPGGRTSRPLVVYLGLVLVGAMLTTQQFSTLSVFAHGELGLSLERIGQLYTINGVLVVLLQVPAVALIDAGGPRRALMLGPAMYGVAYFCFGLAGGFTGLALAMVLLTTAEVVFAPALSDMAAHLGDRKHLGRTFGLFGLVQQLGVSLGPLAGGLALDHLRHDHLAFWGVFAGAMALLGVGYAWFARRFL